MAPKIFSKKLLRAGQTSVYTNPRSARERKQTRTTAWGVSSVWLERRPVTSEVAGSSPVHPASLRIEGSPLANLFCFSDFESCLSAFHDVSLLNWAMGKRGFAPIWAMGLFGASICSAEPGSPHPCPSIAPLQINPFIAHSQCYSKRCWANLAYSAIPKSPRGLRNKISALFATFFRLGIVASSPIADCFLETW